MYQQHREPARLGRHETQCHLVEGVSIGGRENFGGGEGLERGTGAFDMLIDRHGHGAGGFDVALFDERALFVRRTHDQEAGKQAERDAGDQHEQGEDRPEP